MSSCLVHALFMVRGRLLSFGAGDPRGPPPDENLPMLHVRVASPPGLTGRLVDTLAADPGVLNLVVLKGTARHPDGDAVQFDLRVASANLVFQHLRDLRLNGRGSVMVETVDAPLTEPEGTAGRRGLFHAEVAPVWEMVEAAVRAGARYPPSFFGLLVIAGLIACVGILTNSQILVVGAMVVGPEYQAIIAVALGLGLAYQDWRRAGGSAVQLLLNVVLLTLVGAGALRAQRLIWRRAGSGPG
jgi:hypothetical protein